VYLTSNIRLYLVAAKLRTHKSQQSLGKTWGVEAAVLEGVADAVRRFVLV
jgi:hypothetical protein